MDRRSIVGFLINDAEGFLKTNLAPLASTMLISDTFALSRLSVDFCQLMPVHSIIKTARTHCEDSSTSSSACWHSLLPLPRSRSYWPLYLLVFFRGYINIATSSSYRSIEFEDFYNYPPSNSSLAFHSQNITTTAAMTAKTPLSEANINVHNNNSLQVGV
jgi:hypothetical protein